MNEYLRANLMQLKNKNIRLATIIDFYDKNNSSEKLVEYEQDKANMYFDNNHHRYYLHSRYNKVEEAEEKVSVIDFENKKVIFVIGFGAGYHIRAIQEKMSKDCTLVVIESEVDIMYNSLKYIDLKDVISNPNTYFLLSNNKTFEKDLEIITLKVLPKISNFDIFILESSKQIFEENYMFIKNAIYKKIIHIRKNVGNSPLDTLRGFEHMLINSMYTFENKKISFENISNFKNIPVVSVASGPSLNKNIHILHRVKDKALIICCESAYDKLLKEGIKPHIITALERDKVVYDTFFKDRTFPDDIMLIGQGVLYPEIFKSFEGDKISVFRENLFIEKWVAEISNSIAITIGPSVANLNIAIAKMLNSKCLILIGQDLAYSESGNSHAGGTVYENKTIEDEVQRGHHTEYVEDIYGNTIKTTHVWKFFLEWINQDVKSIQSDVIDATEGGAKIENTKIMTLEEAVDKYCTEKFDIKSELSKIFLKPSCEETINNLDKFIRKLNEQKRKSEEIGNIIIKNKNRLEKFNLNKKFDAAQINEKVLPINNDIHYFPVNYPIFYQIVQSKFINISNFNSKLSYIDELNIGEWKRKHYEFFTDMEIYHSIYKDILLNGEKIIAKLEEKYVSKN